MIQFNKFNTRLNVKVSDWREAIRVSGELLLNQKVIEEKYINGIIESIEKYGPYIIIFEGFAIPHCRPELGALETGFSLVTLENGVLFDGEDQQVKILLAFSAVDNESHLEILKTIVTMVEEGLVEKIANVKRLEEINEILGGLNE